MKRLKSKTKKKDNVTHNPFLERTIENWLKSVNERGGYHLPFCQILISKGHKILYISTHTIFEQGKDIVSLDPDGELCAFQLKAGRITNSKWRNEVRAEVEELIDYAISDEIYKNDGIHKSYLVTNGTLSDTVIHAIEAMKRGKYRDRHFEIIDFNNLLGDFLDFSKEFLPDTPFNYKEFLDLYFSEKEDLLPVDRFSVFLESLVDIKHKSTPKEQLKRKINLLILFSSYILGGYYETKNYVAVIQGLGILISKVFLIIDRWDLKEKYWAPSVNLIKKEFKRVFEKFREEVFGLDIDDICKSIWDGELSVFKRFLALENLFLSEIFEILSNGSNIDKNKVLETLNKFKPILTWGESALYTMILIYFVIKYYRGHNKEIEMDLITPLKEALISIIQNNGRNSRNGLLSPYYSIEEAIKQTLPFLNHRDVIYEGFERSSWILDSIVQLMVQEGQRKLLAELWREITYISCNSFVPKFTWQSFLYRSNEGINESRFYDQEQSWGAIVKEYEDVDDSNVSTVLKNNLEFIPIFLSIYPYRINRSYIKIIYNAIQDRLE